MAIISNAVTMADAGAFSVSLGAMTLIKTITLSSAAGNVSFVHGSSSVVLDDTYPIYKFVYLNLHPSANQFAQFNMSTDTGSNYNVSKTTTNFNSSQGEGAEYPAVGYQAGNDLANDTAYQVLSFQPYTGNDSSISGELTLFNPSSTTFVKHFMGTSNVGPTETAGTTAYYHDGYCNTTAAIDGIQFSCTGSGSKIGAGIFKLYGIKDS